MQLMQQKIRKQNGLSVLGMIFVIVSFGLFVVTSFKIGPMYMDFYQIQTIVEAVAKDTSVNLKSKKDIWLAINKRLHINNLHWVTDKDIVITRDRAKNITTVTIDYEARDGYVSNTFIGATFKKSIELIP